MDRPCSRSRKSAWKYRIRAAGLVAASLVLSGLTRAETIVRDTSSTDCCGAGITDGGAAQISWTQTGTFANVAISVPLYSWTSNEVFHIFSYLTTSVGPGTLPPPLAYATVTGSTLFGVPQERVLFSGLTLGPGTYYLTLFGMDPSGAYHGAIWVSSVASGPAASITTAPGVTVGSAYQANGGILNSSYAPASSFILAASGTNGFTSYDFTVTGTPVPEPATRLLALAGMAMLLMAIRIARPDTRKERGARTGS